MDYFFVKRGNIHTPSLFSPSAGSLYYYNKGWNVKALGCWMCAAVFGIPGLVGAYHPTWVGIAATHIYQTGWVICFAVASVFYFGITLALPNQVIPQGYHPEDKRFELLAETDGYFEGDSIVAFPVLEQLEGQTLKEPSSVAMSETSKEIGVKGHVHGV